MIVFINPGHAPKGNPDPGAVSRNGTRESDITATVGSLVSKYLVDAGYDAPVMQSDSLLSVVSAANSWSADVFVSIHCNAAESSDARGAETFHAPYSEDGEVLARAIQTQIVSSVPIANRGVKTAGFYVLKNTDMPAVLIELAFLSNDYDESILTDPMRQDEFARAIARGITDYFGGMR